MTREKFIFLLLFATLFIKVSAQTTPVPDANFEQFLVDQGYDTNGLNGNILDVDAQAVTTLNTNRNDITDFSGLEAFINVTTMNLGTNQFATLPLTNLSALEELVFNQNVVLASLDVSSNTNLRVLDMRANGGANAAPISTLDLSNNLLLERIHIYNFKNLFTVIYPNTDTIVYVYMLIFADINVDFSGYDNLETLTLSVNFSNTLTITVALPNNPNTLKSASFQGGNIVNADLSNSLALEFLSFQTSNTETIQLPNTNTLKRIRISGHNINNISFENAAMLEDLDISNKSTPTPLNLDVTKNIALKDLTARSNYMTNIDITQNVNLEGANFSNNALTTINTSQNILMTDLTATNNQINNLNLSTNIALEDLVLTQNLLPTLDLTTNVELDNIRLGENLLPDLDVTTNTKLRRLYINNNLFTGTGLDLTQNIELEEIDASFNQIEELDISKNFEIQEVVINNNLFTGNTILNQFYQNFIDSDRKFVWNHKLIVHNNNLSGDIPDFASLVDQTPGVGADTYWFHFEFEENNFHFGDFEDQHSQYLFFLSNGSPDYSGSLNYFRTYNYAPQAKVNAIENPDVNAGNDITLTTTVRGSQNHYKWFKDGVEIPDAPDTPTLTLTDVNTCDAGVYHSEITSDLVPFENSNPPGTSGKNLLLIRNDITLTVNVTKDCVDLVKPLNGATNIPINTGIEWEDNPGACGYKIRVGTTTGGTDVVNNEDVGEVTVYNFTTDLAPNQQYFVTITPYYDDGDFGGCIEQFFTTNTTTVVPDCTLLLSPINGAVDIRNDLASISWNPANGADEYRVSIAGSSSTLNNITDQIITGNSYNFSNNFDNGETVTVTITPLNSIGDAVGCTNESFTIVAAAPTVPNCTNLDSPANGATDIAVDTNIAWDLVSDATGYRISINSTSGNNNITDFDNGNSNSYNPPVDFDNDDVVNITITPYNATGPATGCTNESFTIVAAAPTVPNCTNLDSPANGATDIAVDTNISWDLVSDATGYRISINSTSGNNNITDFDNGNSNSYNPPVDFDNDDVVNITITPYNATGPATGCTTESFTVEEEIIPEDDTKYGFSPNGDGVRDTWKIANIENYPNNRVIIYNRWGNVVFEIVGYNNTSRVFDGTANKLTGLGAGELPSGTYFFNIEIQGSHNLKKLKGFIALKR